MKVKDYAEIIRQKRKNTPRIDYIQDILSWVPLNFYKNNGEISRFPDTKRSPKVVSNKEFEEKRDDMIKYYLDYDDNKNFFENFEKLFKTIPMPATIQQMAGENTRYSDMVVESSNCYLSNIVCGGSENIFYSFQVVLASRNVFSSVRIRRSENIYNSVGIDNCSNIFYSKYIKNSSNTYFSSNLVGCQECIFCDGLDNCKYYIKNKKYSKKEYLIEKEKILNSKQDFEKYYSNIKEKPKNVNSINSSGTLLVNCENVTNSSFVNNVKNGNNCIFGGDEEMYDAFDFGVESSNFYGVVSVGTASSNIYCSNLIETCYNMFYCYNCNNSNHCFGCIGLVNKSYCILNKQYSKDKWEEKVCDIMEIMNKNGTLGDFFPHSLNPFYLNQTLAGMFGGFDKSKALELDFLWEDIAKKESKSNLDEIIGKYTTKDGKISKDIVGKTINTTSGKSYTLIETEVKFLNKYNLGIPKKHWIDRIKEHLL